MSNHLQTMRRIYLSLRYVLCAGRVCCKVETELKFDMSQFSQCPVFKLSKGLFRLHLSMCLFVRYTIGTCGVHEKPIGAYSETGMV